MQDGDEAVDGGSSRARHVRFGRVKTRERPIQDLVDGLVQLGVDAECTMGTGCPPVRIDCKGLPGGKSS